VTIARRPGGGSGFERDMPARNRSALIGCISVLCLLTFSVVISISAGASAASTSNTHSIGVRRFSPVVNAQAAHMVSDLTNGPIAAASGTTGYWLVASDGGIFTFGDAGYYGSTGGIVLNKPIVGMAPTPDGKGYWLVASDGGIFTFGDAGYYGSTGGIVLLNKPIVGMAPTPDGKGYWLVASDGGIFTFGDAGYYGSEPSIGLSVENIVGIAPSPTGNGYWIEGSDGRVSAFGDASPEGSMLGTALNRPIVGFASISVTVHPS
jgi:hypothetical protein